MWSKTLEVVGLNPTGCWAFFFSSLSHQYSVLNSGPLWRFDITDFPIKICLAVQLEAKHGLNKKIVTSTTDCLKAAKKSTSTLILQKKVVFAETRSRTDRNNFNSGKLFSRFTSFSFHDLIF